MQSRRAGFTLIEIMIAVTILVVGLLGILALFPYAIHSGRKSVQQTTAVLIAQSVEQAIREGISQRKGQSPDGKWTYFLFYHDGVTDPLPRNVADADPSKDYYILFPDIDTDGRRTAVDRVASYESGKLFVFPETDGIGSWEFIDHEGQSLGDVTDESSGASPNGGGSPASADDDKDDREVFTDDETDLNAVEVGDTVDGAEVVSDDLTYQVFKTYRLGSAVSMETDDNLMLQDQAEDPIRNYSFAFSIRRALDDASLMTSPDQFSPGGELFEVEVMVFRAFLPNSALDEPLYTTQFLVSK